MAGSLITPAFEGSYFVELAEKDKLPSQFENKYGDKMEDFFVITSRLKEEYGSDYDKVPPGALAVYTCLSDRIGTGLQQLLAGPESGI